MQTQEVVQPMFKAMRSPKTYIQGPGLLFELDRHMIGMGNHFMLLITQGGLQRFSSMLKLSFSGKQYMLDYHIFTGESTREKMESCAQRCLKEGITAIIGIGGGKVMDTAKGAAHYAGIPVVLVPTVCSTDAPCSSLSILYDDNGVFQSYLHLDSSPDAIMIDTSVIARSPASLLVAGMGDAMSTYFEARACLASGSPTPLGSAPTVTAYEIAALCWKYLQTDGLQAKKSVEQGVCSPALERIIEVNSYQSCIGFESGGLAAAHGIQKGFTVVPELHRAYHGFKVAFCTLAQLILENAPEQEQKQVLEFCHSVGLPICFKDLGYEAIKNEDIRQIAEKACAPGSTVYHLPCPVTPEYIVSALKKADAIGRAYHASACR